MVAEWESKQTKPIYTSEIMVSDVVLPPVGL